MREGTLKHNIGSNACPRTLGVITGITMLSLAACAHAPRGQSCTLPGGDSWRELQSRHFIIEVAKWRQEPAKLVMAFEQLHAAVVAALIAEPVEIPARVRVIVLPDRLDVEDLVGPDQLAVFWVSRLGEPTILMSAEDVDALPQLVAHELAHWISYYLFPRQPRWFSEGLAQFVESVAKVDKEGRRWAGGSPLSGWGAGNIKLTPPESLWAWKPAFLDDSLYVTSWVLYRFLWNERSAQFTEFQRRLSAGDPPKDAWRLAFPEWEPKSGKLRLLEGELEHYRRHSRGLRWEIKLGEVDQQFVSTAASRSQIHLLLLDYQLSRANRLLHKSIRRAVAEEALREDPQSPLAVAELASLENSPLLPAMRAAAAARSTDGVAWYFLGRTAEQPVERESALRQAALLWPDGAVALAALAVFLASSGRAGEALPFANRAVELAPWSPDVVAALALVAMKLEKCREALLLQARAVEVAENGGVGAMASDEQVLRRDLSEYRRQCGESSGTVSQADQ